MYINPINYVSVSLILETVKQTVNKKINHLFNNKVRSENKQDVLLILTAADDENGALKFPRPFLHYAQKNHGKIKVVRNTVASIEEIISITEKLKEQDVNIRGLWLDAHSVPYAITLGPSTNKNFAITNTKMIAEKDNKLVVQEANVGILKRAIDCLDRDGVIVLSSCEAGKIEEQKIAIAQSIAGQADGRIVYASVKPISLISENIKWKKDSKSSKQTLEVKFKVAKETRRAGLLGAIINFCYNYLFLFGIVKEDATAKFQAQKNKI